MRSWACLAETIPLFDRHFKSFVYRFNELFGQWRSPAVEHAEAAEIIFVDYMMFPKQQDYWRNDVRERYLLVLDNGTKLLDLEFWHNN